MNDLPFEVFKKMANLPSSFFDKCRTCEKQPKMTIRVNWDICLACMIEYIANTPKKELPLLSLKKGIQKELTIEITHLDVTRIDYFALYGHDSGTVSFKTIPDTYLNHSHYQKQDIHNSMIALAEFLYEDALWNYDPITIKHFFQGELTKEQKTTLEQDINDLTRRDSI